MPLGLAIVAGALLAISASGVVQAWTNYTFSSSSESEMLTLINQARASAGKPALTLNASLTSVARWRSKDMYDRAYFSHSIPNPPGGDVFGELKRRGICYTLAGENIGVNNYPDDVATQTMFNGWMNSPGHRALILGSGFNRIGLGAFKGTGTDYPKHMWTAVFTHTCSGATPPATPRPVATPRPTPKATLKPLAPTPRPTPRRTDAPASAATPEPRVSSSPEVEPTAAPATAWAGWRRDGFRGTLGSTWPHEPPGAASPTSEPATTEPPPTGGIVTDADGGSLQVVEPASSRGLLDTIVGDVVAAYLGK
jgi:uncharacterized protein YkwD